MNTDFIMRCASPVRICELIKMQHYCQINLTFYATLTYSVNLITGQNLKQQIKLACKTKLFELHAAFFGYKQMKTSAVYPDFHV